MDCWGEIRKLKGKTLKTLDGGNPFDVVDVTERAVIVRPHEHGTERRISRDEIEDSCNELMSKGEITRIRIHERYSQFNPAYVAAMLAALPGVTHTIRPIHLRYGRSNSR
jgi:hypothetical protein